MKRKHTWLSDREKIQGTAISKEGHADRLMWHEMTSYYWYQGKK